MNLLECHCEELQAMKQPRGKTRSMRSGPQGLKAMQGT